MQSRSTALPPVRVAKPVSPAAAGLSRWTCRLAFLPLYYACTWLMRFKAGYVIQDLPGVRRQFKELSAGDEPFIICANHLTIVDSALILWACGSGPWYLRNFNKFSWNLPAGDFFKKSLFYRFMGAISKCLYIHRDGSKEHKDSVVRLTTQLVRAGEVVTIFPEGKRSRSGRFDPGQLTYGVGKMVSELGGSCRVLCVYVRGNKQETFSNYPAKGSRIHFEMKVVRARTAKPGRDGYKEVVDLIGRTIKDMEDRYFAAR